MSRSGYIDYDDDAEYSNAGELYRAAVDSALYGKRGQAFLRELVHALDALPRKALVADALVTADGAVCALGAVAVARGIEAAGLDPEDADAVAGVMGIAPSLAREVAYQNDESFWWFREAKETETERFKRMRKWAVRHIRLREDELLEPEPLTPATGKAQE